ncbi:tripartite tricarboxylate transporter substrate binding protein BugD [Methylobacterium sp. C25]|nr:tripartite tricarboxylate transporter substrate binding protein BugD [Methylobacterium sp. C25]
MSALDRSRALLAAALAVGAVLSASVPTMAEEGYPDRPIALVVPFAAGGPTDTIARIIAPSMAKALGQTIRIENISGGGGTTGITEASRAKPDGYTIMVGHMGTHGAAPALFRTLKYDPARTFDPIGVAAGTPVLVVARKDFPASDLKGFIETLQTKGATYSQAHAGVGSVSHSTGMLFDAMVNAKPTFVVYRGTGPAMNDLVSGQVDFMTDQIVNVVPHLKAGTIRAYAIATPERSPALPDVPTTREAGLPGFEVSAWNAVFAPKNLPKDVRAKLVGALDAALDDPTVRERLLKLGGKIPTGSERGPAALQKLVESEVARWTPALSAAVDNQ